MSETKFTQGPWLREQTIVYTLNDDKVNHFWCQLQTTAKGADHAEIAANARLIAAAPDLYTALAAMIEDLQERADIYEDGTRVLACGNGVLYKANRALAKATGDYQNET